MSPRGPTTERFLRRPGPELGIDVGSDFSFVKTEFPFVFGWGRAVASGDVNRDGWIDLLVSYERGVALFINHEGRFVRQRLNLPGLVPSAGVLFSALVDLDGDGWLDIVSTTFDAGLWFARNDSGAFEATGLSRLAPASDRWPTAMAFDDLDADGDYDIILGRWRYARAKPWGTPNWTWMSAEGTDAVILWQEGKGTYREERLPAPPGAPTSILVHDLDGRGGREVILGNDYAAPDRFFERQEDGRLRPYSGKIQQTSRDTMSIDAADIDNDGVEELFFADISFDPNRHGHPPMEQACRELTRAPDRAACFSDARALRLFHEARRTGSRRRCAQLHDQRLVQECEVFLYVRPSSNRWVGPDCTTVLETWPRVRALCEAFMREPYIYSDAEARAGVPQKRRKNVLLRYDGEAWIDVADALGVAHAGWAWNARFQDLNNDEYADLYVVNGSWRNASRREPNRYFENVEGRRFEERAASAGLAANMASSSFTLFDIDRDGDIDIVLIPQTGPVVVYLNEQSSGHAVTFEVVDSIGPPQGVGAVIRIEYGDGRRQVRTIRASGGFGSFDAPETHFGLGLHATVDAVNVTFSDGARVRVEAPLPADHRIRITRR